MQHLFMKLRKHSPENRLDKVQIFIFVLLIFVSCVSQPTTPRPDWVLTSNSNPNHWVGVGSIEKPFSGNIRAAARSQAVNEIASQITIQISSNFTNIMTEYNYDISTFSKSIIDSRVENNLGDIEYLNFHEDEYRFYVHARLSKEKYYESLAKKRENAVHAALGYLQRADSELNGDSFNLLQSAIDEIVEFMDEPLKIEYEGKSQNLYSLIKLKFQDKVNRVQIFPAKNEIEITFGFSKSEIIEILTKDKQSDKVITGIPVKIETSDKINLVSGITDLNGKLLLPLPNFDSFESQKQIIISMDFHEIQLSPNSYPKTPISIKINSPSIFVDIEEKLLGKKSENPIVGPMIKDFFSANLFAIFGSIENADLIINGNVNTSQKSTSPNEWGIYQTFADATITVLNGRTGDDICSVTLSKVQGADFNSNEGSAKEAIKKIAKEIEKITIPQIFKRMEEF